MRDEGLGMMDEFAAIRDIELEQALREVLLRPVPASLAGEIRIAVAEEVRRPRSREARVRRVAFLPLRQSFACAVLCAGLLGANALFQKDQVRKLEAISGEVAGKESSVSGRKAFAVPLRARPLPVSDSHARLSAGPLTVQRRARIEIREATWIDEPEQSARVIEIPQPEPRRAEPARPSQRTETGTVVVNDEIRNEKTTCKVARHFDEGRVTQVQMTFESRPMVSFEGE